MTAPQEGDTLPVLHLKLATTRRLITQEYWGAGLGFAGALYFIWDGLNTNLPIELFIGAVLGYLAYRLNELAETNGRTAYQLELAIAHLVSYLPGSQATPQPTQNTGNGITVALISGACGIIAALIKASN